MSVSGPGVPGCNFIIQASTDLIHWVNLATNASPLAVVDSRRRSVSGPVLPRHSGSGPTAAVSSDSTSY